MTKHKLMKSEKLTCFGGVKCTASSKLPFIMDAGRDPDIQQICQLLHDSGGTTELGVAMSMCSGNAPINVMSRDIWTPEIFVPPERIFQNFA